MKIKKKIFAGVLTAMMLVLTMGTTVFAAPSPDSDVVLQQKTDEINKATSVDSNAVNSNNEIINIENIADKVQDVKTFFEHLKCGFDMLEEVKQIYLKDIGQVY